MLKIGEIIAFNSRPEVSRKRVVYISKNCYGVMTEVDASTFCPLSGMAEKIYGYITVIIGGVFPGRNSTKGLAEEAALDWLEKNGVITEDKAGGGYKFTENAEQRIQQLSEYNEKAAGVGSTDSRRINCGCND